LLITVPSLSVTVMQGITTRIGKAMWGPRNACGNQGTLHDDVRLFLEDPARPAEVSHTTVDADHGRIETRTGEVSTDIGWLQKQHAWPNLAGWNDEFLGSLLRV
jgi:hypothetical protein